MFSDAAASAVLAHMNGDHADDNLLIARAFAPFPHTITGAVMTGLEGAAGLWRITRVDGSDEELRVPWPAGEISDRAEARRELVALYEEACIRLGIVPRSRA